MIEITYDELKNGIVNYYLEGVMLEEKYQCDKPEGKDKLPIEERLAMWRDCDEYRSLDPLKVMFIMVRRVVVIKQRVLELYVIV